MRYQPLGHTGIDVSIICLGTMTWGEQNTRQEGFDQMDHARENGVNFFDTAEMYPVDVRAETYGHTESIIGAWMSERACRKDIILASKVCGPGRHHVRDGDTRFDRKTIHEACEGSLGRLQTDYIDLYQLHWPDRGWTDFKSLGQTDYIEDVGANRDETIAALNELVQAGKIRSWGVSNESAWGLMDYIQRSDANPSPRPVGIQNAYSLLNRKFELALAEVAIRENVGLLAYAPIAAGVLTGKYLNDARPKGARNTLWPSNTRYFSEQSIAATRAYIELAAEIGIAPEVLAHAFVLNQTFLTASIVGATQIWHLDQAFAALDITLDKHSWDQIDALHRKFLVPAP
jgi:aryl-alcohol dehydrogenase-like predicted oxidoreductase